LQTREPDGGEAGSRAGRRAEAYGGARLFDEHLAAPAARIHGQHGAQRVLLSPSSQGALAPPPPPLIARPAAAVAPVQAGGGRHSGEKGQRSAARGNDGEPVGQERAGAVRTPPRRNRFPPSVRERSRGGGRGGEGRQGCGPGTYSRKSIPGRISNVKPPFTDFLRILPPPGE
jgi:hypothetical protein